ncbi:hypothetical protein F2P56_035491 [Juglans regia]|uniref:Protein indeterminate-domain 5, chloroplastic-like n=2 Tax=Juglans regia TaxID=51240 RepID=A0A2I4EX26_JUGRE|nr:protein indeterminate-domain 5, chloroplastic-like [Juglans regia]KAF5442879.1 hypothetical protein F2P56_035491 [Juglans regia]
MWVLVSPIQMLLRGEGSFSLKMSASSSSVLPVVGIREEDQNQMMQQISSVPNSSKPPPPKKKRNQPGTPYPDAEVIALSPKTLMATNRFICEVCNKGFQREQNLQLHRRGHNLPWKLKQKTTKELPKRKVYLCPEPTCVHHDPLRALGDLTGIKKHYSRKHGEKKWKCEKCSKRYAVQSDWKAHSKTCGTREYRCDCGTLFSRRDSFITHRAFCDALARETSRHPPSLSTSTMGSHLYGRNNMGISLSQVGPQFSSIQDQNSQTSEILFDGARQSQFHHILPTGIGSSFRSPQPLHSSAFFVQESTQNYEPENTSQQGFSPNKSLHGLMQFSNFQNSTSTNPPTANNLFNLNFLSSSSASSGSNIVNANNINLSSSGLLMPNHFDNDVGTGRGNEGSSIFSGNVTADHQITTGPAFLHGSSIRSKNANLPMSATSLLQKAAQMGSTSSKNSASPLRTFKSDMAPLVPGSLNSMFGGNGNHLQDLMNSFATGNSIFGSGSGGLARFDGYHANMSNLENMDERQNLHQNPTRSVGASDSLTRDFLGVGQIVRSMSGVSQREQQIQHQQQHGMDTSSSYSDRNTAPSSQSFGGGGGYP